MEENIRKRKNMEDLSSETRRLLQELSSWKCYNILLYNIAARYTENELPIWEKCFIRTYVFILVGYQAKTKIK